MSSQKLKVLMVLNDLAWFWSHRLPLANGILARGWDLTVATHGAASDEKMKAMGVEGIDLADPGEKLNPIAELKLIASIAKAIRNADADIIHAITLRHAFYTGLMARLFGHQKKIIFTIAGLGSFFSSQKLSTKILRVFIIPFMRFAFRHKNAAIIFQNPDDFKLMRACSAVGSSQSVIIRGSGVDLQKFPFAEIPGGDPVLLFSSRLLKEKGLGEFVSAARLLKEKGVKARFEVAGAASDENPRCFKPQTVQAWHDEGLIHWHGQISDMPALIKQCTIFVLPSYYREGVPKVSLEALSVGRPVITTDMPGCRETVEDGVNGFLVLPKDPVELAEKIETLLSDPARLKAMGKASRAKAESEFGVDFVVERTLEIYDGAKPQRIRKAA